MSEDAGERRGQRPGHRTDDPSAWQPSSQEGQAPDISGVHGPDESGDPAPRLPPWISLGWPKTGAQ